MASSITIRNTGASDVTAVAHCQRVCLELRVPAGGGVVASVAFVAPRARRARRGRRLLRPGTQAYAEEKAKLDRELDEYTGRAAPDPTALPWNDPFGEYRRLQRIARFEGRTFSLAQEDPNLPRSPREPSPV